jgi:hypothetical protein
MLPLPIDDILPCSDEEHTEDAIVSSINMSFINLDCKISTSCHTLHIHAPLNPNS